MVLCSSEEVSENWKTTRFFLVYSDETVNSGNLGKARKYIDDLYLRLYFFMSDLFLWLLSNVLHHFCQNVFQSSVPKKVTVEISTRETGRRSDEVVSIL